MILVTRLNGGTIAINPDLLHRIEETPDTVLTLIDGTRYLVEESLADVVEIVADSRAKLIARVQRELATGELEAEAH